MIDQSPIIAKQFLNRRVYPIFRTAIKIFDGVGKMVEREAWGMMPSALVVCRQQLARGCQGPKVVEAIALVWNGEDHDASSSPSLKPLPCC